MWGVGGRGVAEARADNRWCVRACAVNISEYATELNAVRADLPASAQRMVDAVEDLSNGLAVSGVDPGFGGGRVHLM